MVAADRTESLAVGALQAFLANRVELKEAVLSLGLYSEEIRRLLKMGHTAAKRIGRMDRAQLRALLAALTPRAEVNSDGLYISCHELSRLLSWGGVGLFQKSVLKHNRAADRIHVVHAPAFLICGHPRFALPIDARTELSAVPSRDSWIFSSGLRSCGSSCWQTEASRSPSSLAKSGWDRAPSPERSGSIILRLTSRRRLSMELSPSI